MPYALRHLLYVHILICIIKELVFNKFIQKKEVVKWKDKKEY